MEAMFCSSNFYYQDLLVILQMSRLPGLRLSACKRGKLLIMQSQERLLPAPREQDLSRGEELVQTSQRAALHSNDAQHDEIQIQTRQESFRS